ncbi:type I methionyl aminopeptidase [Brachybacterium halotolerans subsp. kimchii]|uniref:Methionine aminopeptidase n=1 Tax=Brachybacterium halotolerans TaxID=2795215 RepID=A0ABS1B6H1_9MICO|nr:type I methionyl aminopeptidase [Brachybacterium halotolerans]MBK0330097.1 type I methionyl aminopeptidase [Brachybacterium halotolerans]UEJ83120.1 type I methionyl aminopeptidase [Brachybacterium halotolerans subsp. kimchii]
MTVEQRWIRPEGREALVPGRVGPSRAVPASIERPEYVGKDEAASDSGPHVQSQDIIERMREPSRIAALALQAAGEAAVPGATTDDIDAVVHDVMVSHGAYPSTLGYLGFPKSCCTSLNEVVCHGIPDSTVMQSGDILNVDVTAFKNGVHGDTNATFLVGEVDPRVAELVERSEEAMMRGIRAGRAGRQVNVIGRVIEKYVGRFGYESVHDFTGHGVAEGFHNGLVIPHYDSAPMFDDVIEQRMTFTVEPMVTLGSQDWEQWDDGWTVVTKDRSFTAQFEHTLVITDDGFELLTVV